MTLGFACRYAPIGATMTAHVVTRSYRAPEAILCAGNYSQVGLLLEYMLFYSRSVAIPRPPVRFSSVESHFRLSTCGVLDACWLSSLSCSMRGPSALGSPFCFTAQFLLEKGMVRPPFTPNKKPTLVLNMTLQVRRCESMILALGVIV